MTDFRNEIAGIKKMPILKNKNQAKQDKYDEFKKKLLDNPEIANKLRALADDLDKNFNASTQIATNIRVGAMFLDTLTNKKYCYEHFVMSFAHDHRTIVITEMANHPLEEYPCEHHMVFYDPDSNPSPRYLMSAIDFCIYLACKVWVVVDANNSAESQFLDSIR